MKRIHLDWIGLTFIAWSALARAMTMAEPFPGWDADPTRIVIAIVGLGPTGSLLLDAIAWLGAGLVLTSRKSRSTDPVVLLALLGAVLILVRTFLIDAQDAEAIRIASSWAAGWAGFTAIASLAHRKSVRVVLGSVLLASVVMLASKGLVQTFVEHPLMLEQFDSNKDASLIAQGFQAGSEQALIYERRLRQPDPTGWFGLSNVLATYLALGSVAILFAGHASRGSVRVVLVVVSIGLGAILLMTGSKAGIGVAGLGVLAGASSRLIPARYAKYAIIALVVLPTLAVIARGVIGFPAGEKSLLFRWFYAQGAAGVAADSLPLGTGPAGFQDAYMLHKPPLATEDVTSPHMVLLDYIATLGLIGLPLIGALLWSVWRFAFGLNQSNAEFSPSNARLRLFRPQILILLIAPILLGVWLESQATTIESALGRLVGLAGWAGLSMLLIWVGQPTRRVLAVAGVVLLCHAQLDMVLSLPGSAPLGLSLLALAAGSFRGRCWRIPRFTLPAAAGVGLGVVALLLPGMWTWEALLRSSSGRLGEVVAMGEGLLDPTPADVREFRVRQMQALTLGFEELESASETMPADGRTASEAARVGVMLAEAATQAGYSEEADGLLRRSIERLNASNANHPRAGLFAQTGSLFLLRADLAEASGQPEERVREFRAQAIESMKLAAERSPRSARHPSQIALTLDDLGDQAEASTWAHRALELDRATALDPLSSLPTQTRIRLEGIAQRP